MNRECGRWVVEIVGGTPLEIHALDPPLGVVPTIWVIEPAMSALVLGSTQPADGVDDEAAKLAGLAVVRRRSGGGAVLVDAEAMLWIDIIVPTGDRLWSDDVGVAPLWVGHLWADVARGIGMAPEVHTGPMVVDDLARQVCFVGRAPGEVTVDGYKLVGISQRRTRDWARFQCAFLLRWESGRLIQLLEGLDLADQERVHTAARGAEVPRSEILDRFMAEMAGR